MKRLILYWYMLILVFVAQTSRAQTKGTAELPVSTIVQAGLDVRKFEISSDKRYVLAYNSQMIALWDLYQGRLVKISSVPNKDVRFHPINPTWVLVRPIDDNFQDPTYYSYNLFTGEKLGIKKEADLQPRGKWMEDLIMDSDGISLYIKSRSTGQIIGKLEGHSDFTGGRISINKDDNLLLQTGLRPIVWDLSTASIAANIPILDYWKKDTGLYFRDDYTIPLPSTETYRIKKGRFHYGYRSFFDGTITDDHNILLGGYNSNITCWDLNGNLINTIHTSGSPVYTFRDCGEHRVVATYRGLNMGKVCSNIISDCPTFNKQSSLKLLYDISPIYKNKYFFTGGDDKKVLMGELGNPDYRRTIINLPSMPMGYDIDHDQSHLLIACELGYLVEMNITNPKDHILYNTDTFRSSGVDCAIYLNDDWIIAGCTDGLLGFWKRGLKEIQRVESAHRSSIVDLKLSHNGKWLISADKSGMIRIWDRTDTKPIVDIYNLGDGKDYVFLTPDNYYKGSNGAFNKIHFARGLQVLTFEQFDLIYNRPDIILKRLGQPEEVTKPYYMAWKKRLRMMGYTESMLSEEIHAPELSISNIRNIPKTTTDKTIELDIIAKDNKYKLKSLLVTINGVPIYGKKGKAIDNYVTGTDFKKKININLCRGQNRIDISCLNDKGIESYRQSVEVFCDIPKIKPRLYIAAIGVSDYAQNNFNLKYAEKDANDFINIMQTVGKRNYESIESVKYTNEQFTARSLTEIKQFFSKAKRDDVIMLFYAGHGLLDQQMDYYLGTYNTNFADPSKSGINYEDLEACMDSNESAHRFFFIDACHSGELDKGEYIVTSTAQVPSGTLTFRNVNNSSIRLRDRGLKEIQTIFNEMFVDVRWGIGATIISSSGGNEVSIEGKQWSNGLFTWCIKQGLLKKNADLNNDGSINIKELSSYVSKEVQELSNGTQKPSIRQENRYQDFIILE